jgi:glutathione peroxidase-family protein
VKIIVLWVTVILILSMVVYLVAAPVKSKKVPPVIPANSTVYSFTVNDIDGHVVPLNRYKGKVVLIVNVASKCGFTPQYEGLEKIYLTYKDQGFEILGFPANNFLFQEPGTNAEIKQFCSTKYNVTFPMFAKISVKGSDIAPLYQYLTDKKTNPQFSGNITWNFNKFLVGPGGKILNRFDSRQKPDNPEVIRAIEAALKENTQGKTIESVK